MLDHRVATREEWLTARKELLRKEKDLLRQEDELARQRQDLPWVRVEKEYRFDTADGPKTLSELFDGRSQLLVYHLMFGVGMHVHDDTEACTGCSFVADHFDCVRPHLNGHDVTLIAASIGKLDHMQAYARRMGWQFPWVSTLGSDFPYDFGAVFTEEQMASGAEYNYARAENLPSQREGMSAFIVSDGHIYHTYSVYARGVEYLMGTYRYLDLAPLGRNEDPEFRQSWWRRHDEYEKP